MFVPKTLHLLQTCDIFLSVVWTAISWFQFFWHAWSICFIFLCLFLWYVFLVFYFILFFMWSWYVPFRFATEANIIRYAKIAMQLQNKTVRDVALRCRWMTVICVLLFWLFCFVFVFWEYYSWIAWSSYS